MTEFFLDLIESWGYWGIGFLMFLENVIPPIPSEAIMGMGGYAVSQGRFEFWPLVFVAVLGTTLGNYVWYWIGRGVGYERLRPLIDRYGRWLTMDWEEVEKLHAFFLRWGSGIVFVCRFIPIARTMISLPAGMVRMSQTKFLIWTAAGSTIWITALAGAGNWLGNSFANAERYIGPLILASIAVLIVTYVYRVMTWKPRAERNR